MPDLLVRAIDSAAAVRVVALISTDLAREAARRHGAIGVGACALGRGLSAGLLLATLTKGEERVTVQIRGGGPIGSITIDAVLDPSSAGLVRGYLGNAAAATAPCLGRGVLAPTVGRDGVINVTRELGTSDRYQGQVPLLTGEVDEDVERYLRQSEQVPTALGCDVLLRDGLAIDASAAVMVQTVPGTGYEPVWESQHAVRTGAVYRYLADGGSDPRELARAVYGGPLEFLGEQPVRFQCRCSDARVRDVLRLLGVVEIDEILAERGQAEITCNFCNATYVVERPELESLRAELASRPRESN